MKKLIMAFLFAVAMVAVSVPAHAETLLPVPDESKGESIVQWLNVGTAGEMADLTLEYGAKITNGAVGLGYQLGTVLYSSTGYGHDYPCPHSYYDVIANHELVDTVTAELMIFLGPLYGGVGIAVDEYQTVVQSNVTGWTYLQGLSREIRAGVCAGIMVKLACFDVKAEYSSLRGSNLAMGVAW